MRIILSFILALAAGMAAASDTHSDGLGVMHVQAAASKGMARAGAGYLVIMNGGETDDRLLAVEADFPKVEIHDIETVDGVAKMVHQKDGIAVPAGEEVVLAPGGYHVMFMGLPEPFKAGDSIAAVLVFEQAGRIEVSFDVVEREDLYGGHDMMHGNGDHGGSN